MWQYESLMSCTIKTREIDRALWMDPGSYTHSFKGFFFFFFFGEMYLYL
jgi:hypothetical protein